MCFAGLEWTCKWHFHLKENKDSSRLSFLGSQGPGTCRARLVISLDIFLFHSHFFSVEGYRKKITDPLKKYFGSCTGQKKRGKKRQRKNKLKPKKFGWSSKNSKISSVFGFRFWGRKIWELQRRLKKMLTDFIVSCTLMANGLNLDWWTALQA